VKIIRCDEEISLPVTRFGSRFKLGSLADIADVAHLNVLHLPAHGSMGRQEVTVRQLFVVVAGDGWVKSSDERSRLIGPGYGALFEVGEWFEIGTDSGMTALSLLGQFEADAVIVTRDIVVVDYDPRWPSWFERIRASVWPAVEGVALRIDHVGSTSVPGLAAKSIVDMDVVMPSEESVPTAIERLALIGYRWRGDFGIPGREAFDRPKDSDLPAHHLYVVVEDNKAHVDHWLFRDTLIADGVLRERYATLKRSNTELADGDIEVYVAAKAAFVAELLTDARRARGLPAETYWVPDIELPSRR